MSNCLLFFFFFRASNWRSCGCTAYSTGPRLKGHAIYLEQSGGILAVLYLHSGPVQILGLLVEPGIYYTNTDNQSE